MALYLDGKVSAVYKKKPGINEDGKAYGGNWCFEVEDYVDVKGGEGKRPERYVVNTPPAWGTMQEFFEKRITPFPVLKSVFEGKVFFQVLDGISKPTEARSSSKGTI